MLYLVKMESLDTALASMPPQQALQTIEQMVIPGVELIDKLQAEKKILAGGNPVGTRVAVFIVEAASNSELNDLLASIPLWIVAQTEVTPLESFKNQATMIRRLVAHMKAMVK